MNAGGLSLHAFETSRGKESDGHACNGQKSKGQATVVHCLLCTSILYNGCARGPARRDLAPTGLQGLGAMTNL